MEIVGDDFSKVKNEIEKVKNFLNGEAFNLEETINILSVSNEYSLNKLIELFLYRKGKNSSCKLSTERKKLYAISNYTS